MMLMNFACMAGLFWAYGYDMYLDEEVRPAK